MPSIGAISAPEPSALTSTKALAPTESPATPPTGDVSTAELVARIDALSRTCEQQLANQESLVLEMKALNKKMRAGGLLGKILVAVVCGVVKRAFKKSN